MEEKKKNTRGIGRKFNRKTLIAILSVMVAVIVGLIIAIVVAMKPWETIGGGSCDGSGKESETERIMRLQEVITPIAVEAESMSFDKALDYIDGKIAEYQGTDYAFGTKMVKIYLLMNNGDTEEAIELANTIDEEEYGLHPDQMLDYYTVLARLYETIGDQYNAKIYNDKFVSMYKYINGDDEEDLFGEEL